MKRILLNPFKKERVKRVLKKINTIKKPNKPQL